MILGIDEVGRGPWAGPLVVGAVVLGDEFPAKQNLTDSKKLTPKAREASNAQILDQAAAYGLGWVSATELDAKGLSQSLMLATRRAVKQALATKVKFDQIIIDGTVNFLRNTPLEKHTTTLKKADLTVKEVSAASIIAKVARDRYMAEIALQYPAYGFEKHVGYGTALHRKSLQKQGICPEHRQSFRPIREIMTQFPNETPLHALVSDSSPVAPKPPSSSQKGQKAESAVASYLTGQNHKIIARNFKTKTYEIDLISTKSGQIYFTEVKYSQSSTVEGTPLVRITPEKHRQMQYAAQAFLNTHPQYQHLSPLLAAAGVTSDLSDAKNTKNIDFIVLSE